MVSVCMVLPPAWLGFDCAVSEVVASIALLFFTPSPFLLSSLFVPLLAHCRPSVPAHLTFRHIWADFPWTPRWAGFSSNFRRRLPGPWPAAWTRGGVELKCELNVSYGFSFVRH